MNQAANPSSANPPLPLPLLTFALLAEARSFKASKTPPIPLSINSIWQTNSALGLIKELAFFRCPNYWCLITGIGKTPSLLALSHVLALWGHQISELINLGTAGTLPQNHSSSKISLGTIIPIKFFIALKEDSPHSVPQQSSPPPSSSSSDKSPPPPSPRHHLPKTPHQLYPETLMGLDPHASHTLLSLPQPRHPVIQQAFTKAELARHFPMAELIDMEGYWHAVIARQYNIPFRAYKIISDTSLEEPTIQSFRQRLPQLSQTLFDALPQILQNQPLRPSSAPSVHKASSSSPPQQHPRPKQHLAHSSLQAIAPWKAALQDHVHRLQQSFPLTRNERRTLKIRHERLATSWLHQQSPPQHNTAPPPPPAQQDTAPPQQKADPAVTLANNPLMTEHTLLPDQDTALVSWNLFLQKLLSQDSSSPRNSSAEHKQNYFNNLLKIEAAQEHSNHWLKITKRFLAITRHAHQHGWRFHSQQNLEAIRMEISLSATTNWPHAENFLRSKAFAELLQLINGDLDQWLAP